MQDITYCPAAKMLLKWFSPLFKLPEEQISRIGVEIPIPTLSITVIYGILSANEKLCFSNPSPIIDVTPPVQLIGDIHGNLHDLIRLIGNCNFSEQKIIFLGDYVDRGSYSLEVITLLFALRVLYPKNIFLIRGNHEFSPVNKVYGFYEEVMEVLHDESVWERFNFCFNHLPLIATISHKFLCIHGGISPYFTSLDDITSLNFPISDFSSPLIADLTWSDPSSLIPQFAGSYRGLGHLFGPQAAYHFFKQTGFSYLIRGHQCQAEGIHFDFDNTIITVFSSSNYSEISNKCGWLYIDENLDYFPFSLIGKTYVRRENAFFIDKNQSTINKPIQLSCATQPSTPPAKLMKPLLSVPRLKSKSRLVPSKLSVHKSVTQFTFNNL